MEDNYNCIQHTVDLEHQQIVPDAVDSQEQLHFLVAAAYQYRVVDTVDQYMVDSHTVGNLLVAGHTDQNYCKVDKLQIDLLVDSVEALQLEDNLIGDVDCKLLAVEYMILVLVEEVELVVVVVVVMLVMDMLVLVDHLVDGMLIQTLMVLDNLDHMKLVLLEDGHMVMELVLEYMMLVLLLVLMLSVLETKMMQSMMVLMLVEVVLELLEDTVSNCLQKEKSIY